MEGRMNLPHRRRVMQYGILITSAILVPVLFVSAAVATQDPVKWSAPIDQYPSQWSPTTPPPAYYSPYGYQYDPSYYGYGQYGGQSGYGGAYQGSQPPAQQAPYGNPYYYYGY